MRFCLLTTFFPPYHFGGDGLYVANLANALASDGHAVHVVHCVDSFRLTQGDVEPSPLAMNPAVIIHRLESSLGALSPILTFATGFPLLKQRRLEAIFNLGFDVIHWNNVSLLGGPGAMALGKGLKVCTLHEYWWTCPTHVLFRNNEEACTRRTCWECQLRYRRPPQLWRHTSLAAEGRKHIQRFLAPSRFVQRIFQSVPDPFESTLLPLFVPEIEDRADCLPPAEKSYYLFLGRLEKAKGLQTILPLFKRTRRRLVIAGAGRYEAECRRLAEEAPWIEFRGRVPHDALAALYRGARATVIPSICHETFGLVAVESLRHRTPVISSGFGALPEMIEATKGGYTYRNESDLERILNDLDESPEHGRTLGERGSGNLALYGTRAHLDSYYRILSEIDQHG